MSIRSSRAIIALLATVSTAAPVAAVDSISTSAFDLSVDLQLLGFASVGVGPFATAGGTAPPPFDVSDTVVSVDETLELGLIGLASLRQSLTTGVLNASASSPFPAEPTGTARASVDDLAAALDLVLLGVPTSVLTITAETVSSMSSVDGTGTLSATGSTTLEGLVFSSTLFGALNIDASAFVNPAPNTILFDGLGLTITLNEQILGGNGVDGISITTNAIHLAFDDFLIGTGLLDGDIIIASSSASIRGAAEAVIPEPATWAMMIAGFGLVGFTARRRRRAVAA